MGYRNYSVANGFTVDKLGNGDFTTISSAITAATAGTTIFIRTGTYTENITLKVGVNLVAFSSDSYTPNVIIVGKCTFTTAGTVSISGIRLQTNGDFALAVTGSAASVLNLINCFINCANNTGISYTTSSGSSRINLFSCLGDIGNIGIAIFSSSSAGTIFFDNCDFNNTGNSTTASTASAGSIAVRRCAFLSPFTTSGTASTSMINNQFDTSAINATSLTHGGSGSSGVFLCRFMSGTASAISVSATLGIYLCTVASSNTNAITGAGTLNFGGVSFEGTSLTNNMTTQNGGVLPGLRNGISPAAGYIGEHIRNYAAGVALTNGVSANITSIALTPGVWDVSAIGQSTFSAGGNWTVNIGISSTSATITGSTADQSCSNSGISLAAGGVLSSIVPSFRVILSVNTTYFLVMATAFASGTSTGAGRISATRVG